VRQRADGNHDGDTVPWGTTFHVSLCWPRMCALNGPAPVQFEALPALAAAPARELSFRSLYSL
jgi:hypothetical protein